ATVEWGTGGLIAERLGEVADAADYYVGGSIVRGDLAVIKWLDTPAELVITDDACRSNTTKAMAETIRERLGTGLALPGGPAPRGDETTATATPEICYALATREGTIVRKTPYAGHSAILKSRAAKQALNLVRISLLRE